MGSGNIEAMTRHGLVMPGVVRIVAGQRKRLPVVTERVVPPKKLEMQTGYTWPERGAIANLFQEAKRIR